MSQLQSASAVTAPNQAQIQNEDSKSSNSKNFGIDFTFNTIKDVKKVSWKDSAPWFREIHDGFCWLAYCHNDQLQKDMYLKAEIRARFGLKGAGKVQSEEFERIAADELQT